MMTPTSTFAECDKQVSLKMNVIIRSMGQGRGPKEQGARRAAHSAGMWCSSAVSWPPSEAASVLSSSNLLFFFVLR